MAQNRYSHKKLHTYTNYHNKCSELITEHDLPRFDQLQDYYKKKKIQLA